MEIAYDTSDLQNELIPLFCNLIESFWGKFVQMYNFAITKLKVLLTESGADYDYLNCSDEFTDKLNRLLDDLRTDSWNDLFSEISNCFTGLHGRLEDAMKQMLGRNHPTYSDYEALMCATHHSAYVLFFKIIRRIFGTYLTDQPQQLELLCKDSARLYPKLANNKSKSTHMEKLATLASNLREMVDISLKIFMDFCKTGTVKEKLEAMSTPGSFMSDEANNFFQELMEKIRGIKTDKES